MNRMKTMKNTEEVSSDSMKKRVEMSNGRQIDPYATGKPRTDEKMNFQICGTGKKSRKRFTLVVKKKPYGKSRIRGR
jgi:hypothetical protein